MQQAVGIQAFQAQQAGQGFFQQAQPQQQAASSWRITNDPNDWYRISESDPALIRFRAYKNNNPIHVAHITMVGSDGGGYVFMINLNPSEGIQPNQAPDNQQFMQALQRYGIDANTRGVVFLNQGRSFSLTTSLDEFNHLLPNILDAVCDLEPSTQTIRNEILNLFQRLGPQANP